MFSLLAAAAFFILLHLVVSGTRMRDTLTGSIGQGAYMGLFSLTSVIGLVWLGFSYATARHALWNHDYWGLTPVTRHVQMTLMLVAVMLIVLGLTTPNPTSVRQEATLDRENVVQGMLRITRHPFLWGVALWSTGHLIVNGDRASIVLFGSMLVLSLLGTRSIDGKRKRVLGAKWDAFAAQTSNIPFAAILAGRQSLKLGEIGLWRFGLGLGIYVVLLMAHPMLAGVSALH